MSEFVQDTDETPVIFRKSRRKEPGGLDAEITAVFPTIPSEYRGPNMACYARIGQHGGCSPAWYTTTVAARPEEYADLKRELESAPFGYRLRVYQRRTKAHRTAFDAEQARVNAAGQEV